jgi:hypothetical protein
MANTYKALQTVTVGAGGAASITFTGIPQNYTNLVIKTSMRTAYAGVYDILNLQFNGGGIYLATRNLYGTGSAAASDNINVGSSVYWAGYVQGNSGTANTFGNDEIYIPNYVAGVNKSFSYDMVVENNATANIMTLGAGLWSSTTPITSINLSSANGSNILQYSSFTLYGVFNADVSAAPATPTIGTASDGGTGDSASITFTGVSNAASYTMTSTPGSFTATGTASPIVVSGLTAGTSYTFKVKANNPFGSSAESDASNSVTIVAAGVFESIASLSGTGSSGTISFTSIPSTYKHLQIRYNARCASGAITDHYIKLNNDSGSNYSRHWMFALDSGGPYTSQASTTTPPSMGYVQGYDTNPTTGAIIDILDYQSTSKNKTIKYITGGDEQSTSSQGAMVIGSALWMNNTNAINQIDITLASSNFSTSSTFSLYGIKG